VVTLALILVVLIVPFAMTDLRCIGTGQPVPRHADVGHWRGAGVAARGAVLLCHWRTLQGLALCAWGVLVIGLIDNLLRPILVSKDTRMPDYVVMIATLGGMVVFGINGFVIGPAIGAMFVAVWHI
jgi:hypothetical protein